MSTQVSVAQPALEDKVRRYWQEAWTEARVDYLTEFYAPSFRENDATLTPAEFGAGIIGWRKKFPDFAVTVDRIWSWPGGVATRVTFTGTHLGDFTVLPATGRETRQGGLDIFEFDGDRVVQHWHETDHSVMWDQLGAVVVPGADPAS